MIRSDSVVFFICRVMYQFLPFPIHIFLNIHRFWQKLYITAGNKARLAYPNLSIYHQTMQPNGLYCVLSAAFY